MRRQFCPGVGRGAVAGGLRAGFPRVPGRRPRCFLTGAQLSFLTDFIADFTLDK